MRIQTNTSAIITMATGARRRSPRPRFLAPVRNPQRWHQHAQRSRSRQALRRVLLNADDQAILAGTGARGSCGDGDV
jgi:hypothetical protein